MRVEIVIPDSTLPERQRKIADLASRLTAEPELIDTLGFEGSLKLTPEQVLAVQHGQAELEAGLGLSLEEVRIQLAAHKEEWLAKKLG